VADPVLAYVGIGSNLADPVQQIRQAIAALDRLPHTALDAVSSLYRTPPMGPQDQPDYVNAVVALATVLHPYALLDALQEIERAQNRVRERHWGPRTIDLDLLVHGDLRIADARLRVPHPGLAERAFVVVPLAEIAPALAIPGLPAPAELAARFADARIERLADGPCERP
jgi:2-amino-4-hydroxy-6-hydroxymethyldihydropteridine diphosphokinase